MTREEAILLLHDMKDTYDEIHENTNYEIGYEQMTALDMAIESLQSDTVPIQEVKLKDGFKIDDIDENYEPKIVGNAKFVRSKCEVTDPISRADAVPTVIRSNTLMPTKDFKEWAKRIREVNPNAIVIPCDAEVASAEYEWIESRYVCTCSHCGYLVELKTPFCPNCGVKMKGEYK